MVAFVLLTFFHEGARTTGAEEEALFLYTRKAPQLLWESRRASLLVVLNIHHWAVTEVNYFH